MMFDDFDTDTTLTCLVEKFYKGSLHFHLSPEQAKNFTWEKQEKFLKLTVQSELIKKYPVNNNFSILFFKKLIPYLESCQEVHDDFYIYLCAVLSEHFTEKFCFRHYIIKKQLNNIITIKETNNMVINGTTGMRTWEAAFILSDWAICNRENFEKKTVLELGSGVGFTGIAIAKLCQPSSLILTDCHSDVINTLNENVKLNFQNLHCEENDESILFKNEEKSLEVMMLDWNDPILPNKLLPDVLIGADIVYDPCILHPLCNIFKLFLEKNEELEIYIASIVRNVDTFNSFLAILDSMDFTYEKLSQPRSVFIEWDNDINRCLLKIRNKLR